MATSGTYSYNPILGTLGLTAFSRIKVKRTELTQQHMEDLHNEANLLQVEWVNAGVLLWEQVLQTFTMSAGQATYNVPSNTVMVLDLYISPNVGTSSGQNRLIYPFSRTDYASLGNPNSTGFPTSFFFLRTVNPTLTFWPVPDSSAIYTCSYWSYTQMQDANLASGGNIDIQYLFLDAFVSGLANRLCPGYGPSVNGVADSNFMATIEKRADKAFDLAMKQNTENVPLYINPGLAGYFRP